MMHYGTKYGSRWDCEIEGCDVKCWAGQYTTPADGETRKLRSQCHVLFDPLWEKGGGHFPSRNDAYRWLAKAMQIERAEAHFGMFNEEQARRAKQKIEELIRRGTTT